MAIGPTSLFAKSRGGTALGCLLAVAIWPAASSGAGQTNDYSAVDQLFAEHCIECHGGKDPEGGLVLESFESLMKGGEIGPAITPGKSADSLLVRMVEGRYEKAGKTKIMPPGKRKKLTPEQIAVIRSWIDSGATAPALASVPRTLSVPHIAPKVPARNPVNALAVSGEQVAVARFGEVELRSGGSLAMVRRLKGIDGNVNAVVWSADGRRLFAAGGQPGVSGQVREWDVSDGRLLHSFDGHRDAIYALALSPDGRKLATGSYDQKIKLWDVAEGKELATLSGHNGCVFGLCFRPDGAILASASADRTVKLWDVATGQRRDTFSQSLKEVYAVAFSPDGRRLLAAGGDNRIRVWEISQTAAETTNPILESKFAHEGAILSLVFSPDGLSLLSAADDKTVKLWDAGTLQERLLLDPQTDWSPGLGFLGPSQLLVGRFDGTLAKYALPSGKLISTQEEHASNSPPAREDASGAGVVEVRK